MHACRNADDSVAISERCTLRFPKVSSAVFQKKKARVRGTMTDGFPGNGMALRDPPSSVTVKMIVRLERAKNLADDLTRELVRAKVSGGCSRHGSCPLMLRSLCRAADEGLCLNLVG